MYGRLDLDLPINKSRSVGTKVALSRYNEQYNNLGVKVGTFGTNNVSYIISSGSESITSSKRPKGQRNLSNWCLHRRESFQFNGAVNSGPSRTRVSPPVGYFDLYYNSSYNAVVDHNLMLPTAYTALGSNVQYGMSGSEAQAFINLAADRLRPDLTQVSLPNFLLDFTQIKDLFKLWSNRRLIKNVAAARLNYQFGWKPTISDIQDMIGAVVDVRAKLEDFKRQCGRLIKRSIRLENSSLAKGGTFVPGANTAVSWNGKRTRLVTAYLVYRPSMPKVLNEIDGFLRGMLDSLGFELNPRIIWDKIPFSFVLDWFLPIGTFLGRLKIDTLDLPIEYIDGYVQCIEELRIDSRTAFAPGTVYSSGTLVSDGSTSYRKLFHRVPIFPDYASLAGLGWKFPSLNQATNLISLITVIGLKN